MKPTPKLNVSKVFRRTHDPIWQLQFGVIVIMALQFLTGDAFLPYNKFIIIGFEAVLLVALAIVTSEGYNRVSRARRLLALALIGIVATINIFSLILLVDALTFQQTSSTDGHTLLLSGFTIYVTNIFMFALLYWEIDGGGPDKRVTEEKERDFVFPQMIHPNISGPMWLPGFTDYLYLSTTNVTNFASADTIPISHKAKLLMMVQALVSVVTVVLVATRAIGILDS
ncbi:MAG TPA: hypothetical protein VK497_00940 [Candidatus Saccharimonadales bacterium]|nr:hypothetical protein [Candidatus Saccharimonadales bacterium]